MQQEISMKSITLPIGKTVDPIWDNEKSNIMLGLKLLLIWSYHYLTTK
ncbi:hypothetical protein Q3F45_11260 [Enterococcus faecium]|nr:hypothetical protein [Enterococcus faecium]MDQ8478351.1 hypothetical protein [Enterococcus faecium]